MIFRTRHNQLTTLGAVLVLSMCGLFLTHCKKFEVTRQIIVKTEGVSETSINSCRVAGTLLDEGSTGVTQHGFCWSLTPNPAEALDCNAMGSKNDKGAFFTIIENLKPGTHYYTWAYAEDSEERKYGEAMDFTTLSATLATVETGGILNLTATSAQCEYNILSTGGSPVTERGLCWSTQPLPSVDGVHQGYGSGTGQFTGTMNGLTPETDYYVRAYAINSQGVAYGDPRPFATLKEVTAPTVHTEIVEDVMITTVLVKGSIGSDGGTAITEKGFYWNTEPLPTVDNYSIVVGSGPAAFETTLTGLIPNTTYYVRAFATNSAGSAIGEQQEFNTLKEPSLPSVNTTAVEEVQATTALVMGSISSDGGAEIVEKGFCWNTEPDPTADNFFIVAGSGTDPFEVTIRGLLPNTIYFVRAYAINAAGTNYGENLEFTTPSEPLVDGRNGNIYQTVKIGDQVWMAQNLDVGTKINGDLVGLDNGSIEKYCYQNNDAFCEQYGAMYSWEEMMQYNFSESSQGVCPDGWHIPSDEEWKRLEMTLEMTREQADQEDWRGTDQGGKLKITGFEFWDSPNLGATNESGFNAMPAGGMDNTGNFASQGFFTDFWTSSWDGTNPWYRLIDADHANIYRILGNKGFATSVRCVKD